MAKAHRDGAQTVDRAVAILRQLGAASAAGVRLKDLQDSTGLSRPTVHRILTSLARHGMVEQDAATRRYRLGREMAVLGWSVHSPLPDLRELCQEPMQQIAERTGDAVFLFIRSASDAVCIDVKLGSYPIKALVDDIGTRRPLCIGGGGLAILACLDEEAEEAVYDAVRGRLRDYPNVSEKALRAAVRQARSNGYALSDGYVLPELRGLGMALRDPAGVAVGALSIGGIRDRISPVRIKDLVKMLTAQRAQIERALAQTRPFAAATARFRRT
jgi:DNA-binding IclR family transcriptional regulator